MRRRKAARTSYARSKFGFRARRSKPSNGLSGAMPFVLAGGYGAVRQKGAELMQPLTSKLPFGNIADEVGMFAALWGIKKVIKNPTVNKFATVGQYIEAAQIGQALASGQVGLGGGSQGANQPYVYG